MKLTKTLRRNSLRLDQNSTTPVYLFTLTASEILEIADISRVSRGKSGRLLGYQRPEMRQHVQNIREYLEGESALFPNAVILALSSDVRFKSSPGLPTDPSTPGILTIPRPRSGREKPGWIVDGQQRIMALAKSSKTNLSIPVTAFVTDDLATQRDQFLRINSSKPLPSGLITELLPSVKTTLPRGLEVKRVPSTLCDALNYDHKSPFFGMIRRASMPAEARKSAVIRDTSIVRMLSDSLTTPSGCLYPYRNAATGQTDTDAATKVICVFWEAVKKRFPEAWGLPPGHSRLMHGAGIRSMGRLMDRIMAKTDAHGERAIPNVKRELAKVAPVCRWTEGRWDELDGIPWNAVQNTSSHVHQLSNLLVRTYMHAGDALP